MLLLYFLGVIGVITLAPFQFLRPRQVNVLVTGNWADAAANVLLFVPLGFLYPLTRAAREDPSPAAVFLLGALLSAAIETTQALEPARVTSLIDVVTNAAGAALGAALLAAVSRRIRVNAGLIGRLSLEIPLIGLIYLLVPLLVVASLSARQQPLRMLSVLVLGLVGARLISTVQRNHFGPSGLLDSRDATLVATGWMVLGSFPVLFSHAAAGVAIVAAVATTTWFECSRPSTITSADRRFEADALRRAAPYVVAYLLVMIVLPLSAGIRAWRFRVGLAGAMNDIDAQMVGLLEPVAALTVLGYLLAEARSRRELPFRKVAARVGLECAGVALLLEASRAMQRHEAGSVVRLVLVVAAGVLGAGMYHHQREHVRWILDRRELA